MVGLSRVTPHTEVPILRTGYTSPGSTSDGRAPACRRDGIGPRLARHRTVCEGVKDGDNILLVRRAERAHTDVERAVAPEDIVLQLWIRNALARPVRCRRLEMARRANHSESRGEIRRQDRAVMDGHQTRGLGGESPLDSHCGLPPRPRCDGWPPNPQAEDTLSSPYS